MSQQQFTDRDILAKLIDSVSPGMEKAIVDDIIIGAYWTIVAVKRGQRIHAGLSSTLHGGDHNHTSVYPVSQAGELLSYTVEELIGFVYSDNLLESSVGFALLNALLEVQPERCTERNALDLILDNGRDRSIGVIGHFPFVQRLKQEANTLRVFELHPRDGDLPADAVPDLLPEADVVAITGTSLLNHTFSSLIHYCRSDAYVVILGATTPLSPVMLDFGVDAIAGTQVSNPALACLSVRQGATFRQIRGKRLLTMVRENNS